jgi:hypothetical protein
MTVGLAQQSRRPHLASTPTVTAWERLVMTLTNTRTSAKAGRAVPSNVAVLRRTSSAYDQRLGLAVRAGWTEPLKSSLP